MYTDFKIKNFRIFDQEGTTVPLKPVTILTGCNNSGKSSIVKALCLLKDFCCQLETDYNDGRKLHLDQYRMDFQKSPHNLMGGFNLARHHTDKPEEDSKYISFDLIVESSWLLQDVILHLDFGSLDGDDMNNGYLQHYEIKTMDGDIIYKSDRSEGGSMDFSVVKKNFLHFIYGQYAFSKWQNEVNYRSFTSIFPEDDDDKEGKLFEDVTNSILENLNPTALIMLLEWQVSHCKYSWKHGVSSSADSILKNIKDDSMIINSPSLGVYAYFPCLNIYKKLKKDEVIKEINMRLDSQDKQITSVDHKIVNLFLDSFEQSEADTLHDFISICENKRFFTLSFSSSFIGKNFSFPMLGLFAPLNSAFFDEDSLPTSANWPVVIYAMDVINRATIEDSVTLIEYDEINNAWHYYNEHHIEGFLEKIIEDIFVHLMPGSLSYTPTNIVQPKRLYSLEDNNDFARTLKSYFAAKRAFEDRNATSIVVGGRIIKQNDYTPCTFINKWLKELGIANHVILKSHAEGYGVTIHLYEDDAESKGMLLVDKGYGVMQLFTVLLKIEVAILETQTNAELYEYDYIGLNKDASIIKYIRTHNKKYPATVALEEPECHLHPSLQSKFADMVVDANKQYGIHFLIESHSEYFIRKLQLLVANKEIESNSLSLLYVNSKNRPSYLPVISDIGLEDDGTLKNEFGTGFFDESIRLSRELFKHRPLSNEE